MIAPLGMARGAGMRGQTMTRQMHLAAFLNAGPMGTTGWRHAQADPGFLGAEYYRKVARVLEAARFDLAFIPDALSMPRSLGGSFHPAVELGSGTPVSYTHLTLPTNRGV